MEYEDVRDLLLRQWAYTGGPNEALAAEVHHDDAVLEFPQSGERFVGKASFQAWRERDPAALDFEPREIRGGGDPWIAEGRLLYDGSSPVHYVKIVVFDGDRVRRETLYFADPFPAPDWRRPYAQPDARFDRTDDLPATIHGGS